MKLNNEQLKKIYFEKDFRDIRKHACQILAASPSVMMEIIPDFIDANKIKFLKVIIEDDCFELYLQIKNRVNLTFKYSYVGSTYLNNFKPLYIALQTARKEFVQQLLKDGLKFEDILNEIGVLHLAIEKGLHHEVKENFERLKSDMNKVSLDKFPLDLAAEWANRDMIEFLIEKGADVNAPCYYRRNALYYAVKANKAEVCKLLIAKGADCMDALKWAAEFSRVELFDVIYKNTPDECLEGYVRNAHFEAACEGNLDIFKHICGFSEADPLALDVVGDTFLHCAARKGHLQCMPFIFKYMNQSIDIRNQRGETALMLALHRNREEVVEWLLEKADIFAVDNIRRSCLHFAAKSGNVLLVQLCLDAGIDINSQDKYGETVLYYASFWSRKDIVKYLLENGANPEITDIAGSTCLHAACAYASLDIVKQLVDLLPWNCTNNEGKMPLHSAEREGRQEIVAYLLEEAKKKTPRTHTYENVGPFFQFEEAKNKIPRTHTYENVGPFFQFKDQDKG